MQANHGSAQLPALVAMVSFREGFACGFAAGYPHPGAQELIDQDS